MLMEMPLIKILDVYKRQVHILPPMYYEEYKDMHTTEIAEEVKRRIEKVIEENI